MLEVTVYQHPLRTDDALIAHVDEGQTVSQIIGQETLPAVIIVDGEVIEAAHWHETVPAASMVIQRIPQDRNIFRLIGFIAIAVFAPVAGGFLAGAGASALTTGLYTAGVGIAGSLALNALVPPVFPEIEGSGGVQSIAAITGQSNRLAPFSPIPRLYGKRRYYPPVPMTGQPYTELVGEDQYLRMLLVLGYGPLDIGGFPAGNGHALITDDTALTGDPIKIGDTSIDQFSAVEFEIGDPADVSLFTDTVVEQQVSTSINGASDPTSKSDLVTDNVTLIRTTDTDTDEISLEVYFPALFTISSSSGKTRWARVRFQVHRSPPGAASWTLMGEFTVASKERKPIRRGVRYNLPFTGQYDIRLTRVSTYYGRDGSFFSDATWTVLRSVKRNVSPFTVPNTVVMALRIKATDQLGGRVDRLSVEATSILPVWNGTSWNDAPTRNPAWIYADIFSGLATRSAVAQSRLDTTELLSWANWADTEGIYYDEVIDAEGTVVDRAREVAATGLASWHVTDEAQISVVRDETTTASMVVSPRNSFGFTEQYAYNKLPHALRVQFIDPNRWEPTERIVYDDGYDENNATKYEQLQTIGVTDADQAWKFGRYHLAALRLRPETFTFNQDVQHLAYSRGASIDLAHDVILVGLRWGRIKSITQNVSDEVTSATVDELLLMEVATSYALKIQRSDGSIITAAIDTVSPSTKTVTFTTPVPEISAGVPGLDVGDHFTHGESGSETIKAKITRIEPSGDFRAQITAVGAADNIFDAWTGDIPEFDPVITAPIDQTLLPPVQPSIVSVASDSPPSPTGAPNLRMVIGFEMPPGLVGVTIEAQVRLRETEPVVGELTTEWRILGTAASEAGVLYVLEVEEGATYDVQLRSRSENGRVSSWTSTVTHTIGDSGWFANRIFFSEDFSDDDLARVQSIWDEEIELLGEESIVTPAVAPPTSSSYAWSMGDNSGVDEVARAVDRSQSMQVLSGEKYKITFIWRQSAGAGATTFTYLGVAGFNGNVRGGNGSAVNVDGSDLFGNQHYVACNAYASPNTSWVTSIGFFELGAGSGESAPSGIPSAASGSGAGRLQDPAQLHQDVEYVSPIFFFNSNNQPGTVEFAYCEITRIDDEGAQAGRNLRDSADNLLYDVDVRNDEAVAGALGGSLITNPQMSAARPKVHGETNASRPVGWYFRAAFATDESRISYVDSSRDSVDVDGGGTGTYFVSEMFPVNVDTEYEVVVVARSDNSDSVLLQMPHITVDKPSGYNALVSVATGYIEPEIYSTSVSTETLGTMSLTGTMAAYSYTWTPGATDTWASLAIVLSAGPEHIEIDSVWVRETSTRNTGDLADQNTVGQYDIDLHAASKIAIVTGGADVDIDAATYTTVETIDLALPATITDSVVLVEVHWTTYGLLSTGLDTQTNHNFQARLLDDDNAAVAAYDWRCLGITNSVNESTNASKLIGQQNTMLFLVPASALNANQTNTFTFQLQCVISYDTLEARDYTMRASLHNQSEI